MHALSSPLHTTHLSLFTQHLFLTSHKLLPAFTHSQKPLQFALHPTTPNVPLPNTPFTLQRLLLTPRTTLIPLPITNNSLHLSSQTFFHNTNEPRPHHPEHSPHTSSFHSSPTCPPHNLAPSLLAPASPIPHKTSHTPMLSQHPLNKHT